MHMNSHTHNVYSYTQIHTQCTHDFINTPTHTIHLYMCMQYIHPHIYMFCTHSHLHTRTLIHTHALTLAHIYTHPPSCILAYSNTYTPLTRMHTHSHTFIHTPLTCTYTLAHSHTHPTHTHTYPHLHLHTHTHTLPHTLWHHPDAGLCGRACHWKLVTFTKSVSDAGSSVAPRVVHSYLYHSVLMTEAPLVSR